MSKQPSTTEDLDKPKELRFYDVIKIFLSITLLIFFFILISFFTYLFVGYFDRKPPIDMLAYKASDAKIGGNTEVTMDFYRTRICEYKFIRMITDSKGKIVYQQEGSRSVNGPVRRVTQTDEYPIDRKASPGTATMHLYASWKCPYNLTHEWFPIQKEYTDTLELSLKDGDEDLSDDHDENKLISADDAKVPNEVLQANKKQQEEEKERLIRELGNAGYKK